MDCKQKRKYMTFSMHTRPIVCDNYKISTNLLKFNQHLSDYTENNRSKGALQSQLVIHFQDA